MSKEQRTLFEIMEAVKNNERPAYEDLRYALLALDSCSTKLIIVVFVLAALLIWAIAV